MFKRLFCKKQKDKSKSLRFLALVDCEDNKNPTYSEILNELGTITIVRTGKGVYDINSENKFSDKTIILMTDVGGGVTQGNVERDNDNTITVSLYEKNTPQDTSTFYISIEVIN